MIPVLVATSMEQSHPIMVIAINQPLQINYLQLYLYRMATLYNIQNWSVPCTVVCIKSVRFLSIGVLFFIRNIWN